MHYTSKLKGYYTDEEGTWLKVYVPGVDLEERIQNKQLKHVEIRCDDGRHISNEQRKKIYATVKDICEFTGYLPEEQKEWLKYFHIARTGCEYFSLSNCSMDTAREYINSILDYCLENGVQLQDTLLNRTDDIDHAMYKCIKEKICCVCGLPHADLHHVDAVGAGRNRKKIDDSKHRKMCLCRNHHTEYHKIGAEYFTNKYHVYGIIYEDEKSIEELEKLKC
ncbi:MAG: putative HNHc nuclease [bacterium]|nr:putative HNHc nuclease [bacterium]